jgi:hypothetical protein
MILMEVSKEKRTEENKWKRSGKEVEIMWAFHLPKKD